MSVTSGPNLPQNNLIFNIDCASDRSFTPGSVLINSVGLSGQSFTGYCGPLNNITYNTNEVQAPDGTYTATKIARDSSASCGGGSAWGLLWNSSSTVQAGQTYTNSIYARTSSGTIELIFGLSDQSSIGYTINQNWTKLTRTAIAPSTSRGMQMLTYNTNSTYYVWSGVLQTPDALKDNVRNISSSIYNGPVFNDGPNANFLFDGTNDYILLEDDQLTRFSGTTESFSICAWVKIPSTHVKTTAASIYDRQRYGLNYHYNRYFYFYYVDKREEDTGTYNSSSINSSYVNEDVWNFVVFTYVKNGDGAFLKIYTNGVLSNSSTATYRMTSNYGLTGPFIGNSTHLGGTYYNLEGYLSSVQIYSRAISEIEVKQIFNAFKGRFGI